MNEQNNKYEKMWNIGNYKIQEFCLESFPCQHSIQDLRTGNIRLLYGTDIFVILRNEGLSHPHFEYCREIVRKMENPTPEEIIEIQRKKMIHINTIMRQNDEYNQKQKEFDDIVNKSKASSRIEKLKAQNNICK